MKELKFRVWNLKDRRMYYRGYQKFLHVLLCEKDPAAPDDRGKPVKRAPYGECIFLESTGLEDKNRREIFEGDVVRVRHDGREFTGAVPTVPDTFGAGRVHPLQTLLKKHGITGYPERLDIEVLGNEYENPELAHE
jgi:uncharacterized phage protein (TIGR01671 family)